MKTTVHLPAGLLESIDERARELGLSRNRYIVRALKSAVREETRWSPKFLQALEAAATDEDGHRELDDMVEAIRSRRTSKAPPDL